MVMLVQNAEGVETMLERMLVDTSGVPIEAEGKTLHITLSCGAAVASLKKGGTARELFERADELLRKAKLAGRNRLYVEEVDFYDASE